MKIWIKLFNVSQILGVFLTSCVTVFLFVYSASVTLERLTIVGRDGIRCALDITTYVQNQYIVLNAYCNDRIFSRSSTSNSSRSNTLCSYLCSIDSKREASYLLLSPCWLFTASNSFLRIADVFLSKTNSSASIWFFSSALEFCVSSLKQTKNRVVTK